MGSRCVPAGVKGRGVSRRAGVLGAAAVLAALSVAVPARAGGAGSFVATINAERAARGLRALYVRSDLSATAYRHTMRMIASGRLYHSTDLGAGVGNWVTYGENIGKGASVGQIHRAFMASPTHAANVLRPTFDSVGVAVVSSGGKLWVTEHFARSRGAATPAHALTPPAPRPVRTHRAPKPTQAVDLLLRLFDDGWL